jgi:hypothetical protein
MICYPRFFRRNPLPNRPKWRFLRFEAPNKCYRVYASGREEPHWLRIGSAEQYVESGQYVELAREQAESLIAKKAR